MSSAAGPQQVAAARRPAAEVLSDASAAAVYVADSCLQPSRVGAVGLELEAHCYDMADPSRRPGWDELSEVIAAVPDLPGRGTLSVEPGGAVEISGRPGADAHSAITAMRRDREVVCSVFAEAGLGLALLGADPLRPPQRINPGPRYRAMERFFAASGTAEAGALMMTSTASIQVNLEAGPREGWAQRLRLAHALGPTMIALAANSPLLEGRFTGWLSARQRIWGELDTARCGPILGASGDEPRRDWACYALNAPVMLVHTPDPQHVTTRTSFAQWADGGVLLGGRRPTTADLDYHLTTLFPPVRPRRWLEIRYLDAVPDELWPALVFTLATLLDDEQAAGIAARAVDPVATEWDRAAQVGLADDRLHAAARACVGAAAAQARADLVDSMELLMRNVDQRRCGANDFVEQVVRFGVDRAVLGSAGARV